MRSKRFEALDARPVKKDGFVKEWPEVGLIAMNSAGDPTPSIKVENGTIVEMDGKCRAEFDMLDTFIANYGIRLDKAEEYMAMDSLEIANKLVDIHVPRAEVVDITTSITPAKIVDVLNKMTVLEMMMAQNKMRARIMPSNQCHVTNVKDNMIQIAADAAEAAIRGFDEMETTVGIARYAPFNALAIMIGANVGRPGILTQCAVEEATELDLGMRGYTAYAETISVYGTEPVFMDGDDTPYSKAFLASCYASRGLKMRFTSGSGSEVQMGYAEGKSMLYLEARCLYVTKGAGVQGTQNGSVSCIGVPAGVPGGIREVLAENLLAACVDLECASSNDQTFTHSDLRRCARSLMQMVPGTDYICSGYSATPNYDNMFAGSNWDAEDYDDWNVIQRDLKIDAGLQPADEDTVVAARAKAARAMQVIFKELGLTEITNAEVEAATYANGSQDMPDRDVVADLKAVDDLLGRGATAVDFIKALDRGGMRDVAESIFNIQLQKCAGDYLHTASKLSSDFEVISAVNYPNTYHGVATGYQISDERWQEIQNIPWADDPATI
ncbi:propanediol/glycerol family dehydratase large subunit [Eubacterium aggregans]|uniref:propanediol/glycerol family dehydratase large subunit n=1 Tax=Eubacterium aggregans TaxID=81409 RepID=UPI003F2B36B6